MRRSRSFTRRGLRSVLVEVCAEPGRSSQARLTRIGGGAIALVGVGPRLTGMEALFAKHAVVAVFPRGGG